MQNKSEIPCMIIRGGTSKGIYLLKKDLPESQKETNDILLRLMGSPDVHQLDGLGGATSVTSKVAIISASQRDDADIDYTFAQVSVNQPTVDYKGNCGNISSGVGIYAIENGLIKPTQDITKVRIFNTNTNKILISNIETPKGIIASQGNFSIDGVPGTSAPIKIEFLNPVGSVFNKLLPTDNVIDKLNIPNFGEVEVSIVDVSNPIVFVSAKAIGMTGVEMPEAMQQNKRLMTLIENIRGVAAVKLGLIKDYKQSAIKSPAIPKISIISEAKSYTALNNTEINKSDIHLIARIMSMQKPHNTYALTGAMCTAASAVIKGTVVNNVMESTDYLNEISIGHPNGKITVGINYEALEDGSVKINSTYGYRTARLLMKGIAFY